MAGIQASGVGSGLDINSLVTQLVSAENASRSAPILRREAAATTKISALGTLKGALGAFKGALDAAAQSRRLLGAQGDVRRTPPASPPRRARRLPQAATTSK